MKIAEFEKILSFAGIVPVARVTIEGEDVFVADGFVPPSKQESLKRFGVGPMEYPYGCYMTISVSEDKARGWDTQYAVCDAFHDPGYSPETKQGMRVKTIIDRTELAIKSRRKNATKH